MRKQSSGHDVVLLWSALAVAIVLADLMVAVLSH
jgi:hypothetical protein